MNIFNYFRKKGIDTVDASFYRKIDEWISWYNSNVRQFTFYKVYTGRGTSKRCRRKSMGMAKKLSEDIADLLLNERVMITLEDETTQEFVRKVLDNNHFLVMGNDYQERKAYSGTVAFTSVNWGSVGMNIVRGIASGLTSAAKSLAEAAANAADNALNWVKSKLGIHSPSRVFRDQVGKMMALGMGIGFEKNIPVGSMNAGVQKAIQSLQRSVQLTTSVNPDKTVGGIKNNPIFKDQGFDYDRFERIQRKIAKENGNKPVFLDTKRIDRPLPKGAVPQV